MATIQKFYLHDATTTDTGTLPGASSLYGLANTQIVSGASVNRTMDANVGIAQVAVGPATSPNNAGATSHQWWRRFLSAPLAAQTIASAGWTFAGAATDSLAPDTDNPDFDCALFVWRPSTGAQVGQVFGSGLGNVWVTAETGESGTPVGGADVTCQNGDILVLEVLCDTAGNGTANNTIFYDGTTDPANGVAISSAASFLLAPAPITMLGNFGTIPAGIRGLSGGF